VPLVRASPIGNDAAPGNELVWLRDLPDAIGKHLNGISQPKSRAEPTPGAEPNYFLQLTGGAEPPPHIERQSRYVAVRAAA